ncbi:MAG: SMC-Scp complex subunit ScpB [Desulfobacterales bacterium]|jgi:segregation and condensation protein B
MENVKHIIESLLFVAEEPLTVDRIKNILTHAETTEIRSAAKELAAEYDDRRGGFYLDEVAGGYQIRTRPEYTEWIKKLIQPKPLRLSKPALETLVIIAYKQPIIRSNIEHIRGVDCGGVLRVLLERKLIRVLGRKEVAGRPLIYATTKRFLEVFDLKSLRDLPTPKEIEELGAVAPEKKAAEIFDTAAASETLLENSGGIEAAGERLEETKSLATDMPQDDPVHDTLRKAENDKEPQTDSPDKPFEKSS